MFRLMKRKTNWNKWLLVIVLGGLMWPSVAYQQAPFVGCNPTPTVDFSNNPSIMNQCYLVDLMAVPVRAYNWLLSLAGILFLAMIVWGGTRMMIFFASDAPEAELVSAKLTIRRGIFGFLIIAFSYLVVKTLVNTIFGVVSSPSGSTLGYWLNFFGL